ncbi:MAG: excinuclease ABC subunit UvrA [Pseudomonadota bacterium]|nr:excinuclease ABC subunit UvrA [Pseudomonadota bacterium]
MNKYISVTGAKEHNLKNISVKVPRNSLTIITGLSGSGKSSLAFDTIYAEGQRRYVESLSSYARQFLELMEKPDVESIEGLSPAIAIDQKTTSRNPRSTVGTVTEIYDYMRLLYARVGVPFSPATGLPIESQSVSQMVDRLTTLPEGTRLYMLAPIVRGRKGEHRKTISLLLKRGFQRVRIDGEIYGIEDTPNLEKNRKHDIEVVVDRIIIRDGLNSRLADSIETGLSLSDGILFADIAETEERLTFSSRFACPVSGFTIAEIEPRLFSFNNPFGACPKCDGIGTITYFDPSLVVPDETLSLRKGAIEPWANTSSKYYQQALEGVAGHYKFSMNVPFCDLQKKEQEIILQGSSSEVVSITYDDGTHNYTTRRPFEGVIPNLQRRFNEASNNWVRDDLVRFQRKFACTACGGFRLKPEALSIKIDGKHIGEISKLSISAAAKWFSSLHKTLTPKHKQIAQRILKEINLRLGFLVNVGLNYLTLSRNSGTLSGGESQRIRLASQIGSGLTGVLYVLDEPSIGLHQRDNARLLNTLKDLRDLGNTVLVVEHDEEAILAADHIIDMGQGAGENGGEVVAQGSPPQISTHQNSLTGKYLSGRARIPIPQHRRPPKPGGGGPQYITLGEASANNLKDITVKFPVGTFVCVTGVSGSGKSSLVVDTLYPAVARKVNKGRAAAGPHSYISGLELLDKAVDIDQSPIGRTPRSNPATYTGCFTPIREWFSGLPESGARGYKPGRFSFNVKGGRCESCQGEGVIKVEMHFLPDVYVTCDSCRGARYNRETLEIEYRGKSISNVLEMTVDEAAEFFRVVPSIRDKLVTLQKVGLGYIKVGQPATTLSGGEAQRVKLAKELSRRSTGKTLYILDEPTTGLHFEDVRKLLEVLHALVEAGNTMVVIEHNLEIIKTADWVIDLGPDGGDGGGKIVACGPPEKICQSRTSYTGRFLSRLLDTKSV